jgi:hypothetical protein
MELQVRRVETERRSCLRIVISSYKACRYLMSTFLGDQVIPLCSAFSLNMVDHPTTLSTRVLSAEDVSAMLANGYRNAVGHASTGAVFASVLGMELSVAERLTLFLNRGESCIIGQYRGPRLTEGATVLPDGATIQWLLLWVH